MEKKMADSSENKEREKKKLRLFINFRFQIPDTSPGQYLITYFPIKKRKTKEKINKYIAIKFLAIKKSFFDTYSIYVFMQVGLS